MEHLARISHQEIQHSLLPQKSFSKLTSLFIRGCNELKYLFCNSVAKNLVQLKELCVKNCQGLEAIVMNEGTSDGEIIYFSKLKSLTLSYLWEVKCFYGKKEDMHSSLASPSLQYQPLFDGAVCFTLLFMCFWLFQLTIPNSKISTRMKL